MIEFIEKISVQDEGSKESNIPRLSIDKKNYGVETYFHVKNEVTTTANYIQPSQVDGVATTADSIQPSHIDGEHIGADISQQNKIAVVVGADENDT